MNTKNKFIAVTITYMAVVSTVVADSSISQSSRSSDERSIIVRVDGSENGGVSKSMPSSGRVKLEIAGGAYKNCPNIGTDCGYKTDIVAYINLDGEEPSRDQTDCNLPIDYDARFGDWEVQDTRRKAIAKGKEHPDGIMVKEGDELTFFVVDCEEHYGDNKGIVKIRVLYD